ncbi:MAG: pseudouridine synthase [Bacteroidales bacterium]|nr:pseudouridine synthase [Bacteroidales bacterium]
MERKARPGKASPDKSTSKSSKKPKGKVTGRAGARSPKGSVRKEPLRPAPGKRTEPDVDSTIDSPVTRTQNPREDRPARTPKTREDRPGRTSFARDDRPARTPKPREDRKPADREDRSERTYKPREDRKPADREDRSERTYKPREDRKPADREDRTERPYKSREDRKPADREDRTERTYKPRKKIICREERSERTYKPREDRKPADREERSERPYKSREDRPGRTSADREDRPKRDYKPREDRKGPSGDDSRTKRPFAGKKEGYGRPKRDGGGYDAKKPTANTSSGRGEEGLIRLNKYIANSGVCSRREADDLIQAGVVMVNGKVVTELGTKVSSSDKVQYDNHTIRNERHVYVLLNKPKGYITTTDDPYDRKTVMSLVADACKERIYPVGRLDRNTTGLLLLTNDGEIAKKLTHPRHKVKKVYHVEVDKAVTKSDMIKIATEGVELEDGVAVVDEVAYAEGGSKKEVGVELHSGKNRIVRRIFEALGYEVIKLDRLVFAGLTKKDLPRGKWRLLTEHEVNYLKMLK